MLTRILVDNFRALVNFEFRPGKLCLLLGDNGSGKSSLIESLAIISDLIARGTSVSSLLSYTQTRWDTRDIQRFELDIDGPQGLYRYALEVKHPQDTTTPPMIWMEKVTCNDETLYRFVDGQVHLTGEQGKQDATFPFQSRQSFLANLDSRGSRLGWFKGFIERIRFFQPNPFAMEPRSKEDLPTLLTRYCTNLPSFIDFLSDERPAERAVLEDRIRQIIPGFLGFRLLRMGREKLLLMQFDGPSGKNYEFNLLELSEGQRVLLAMYAALYGMVSDTTVSIFDEPDNYVSLPEIQPWLQALRVSLETHDKQAILISHHPEVIDYLALDSAWRFERPVGPVVARPLEFSSSPDLRPSEIIVRGG